MDTGESRSKPRHSDADQSHRQMMERPGDLDQRTRDGESWRLVDVLLSGGAPWGFTLRGGREHREPLLITKVEEGSKAAAVSLQVGDELVNINAVSLSGFRQEAICLVKGSHKTLTLVVKRNLKMVDIVAQKMPSESDVHVARSFLTKILRSSMRRNEPVSRPHSWHAAKFNESQSETAKTQTPPPPVWQTRYDASSSSTDLSAGWDQTNLRRVSDQFSSLGSMDSLEQVPHPYPSGRLSPAKSNNSAEHLGGGKRDSAYSSFSTSSGTPDYTLSKSNAASTENVLYKVSQWDSGGRHGNGRHSQNLSEGGVKQEDRPGYMQLPGGGGGGGVVAGQEGGPPRTEEQAPGSRHSSSGRANSGPVWHVPEKKKTTTSPSPPPPLPPVRSDSFAATKVHEKGLVIAYPEGPDAHVHAKAHGKGPDKETEASDGRRRNNESRGHNPPAKGDAVNPYISTDHYDHNQLNSNKLYSLSTTDVRVGQPPYAYVPYHQRQYSDESTFYSQSRGAVSVAKPQNVSGYYSSMQELPTNNLAQMYGQNQSQGQNQGRTPAGVSLSSTAIDQNPEGGSHTRYYCVTARQPGPPGSQALAGKTEDRKAGTGAEALPAGGNRTSLSPQTVNKVKYPLPQPQQVYPGSKDSNGYGKHEDGPQPRHKQPPPAVAGPEASAASKPVGDPRGSQRRHTTQNAETHYMSYPPSKQAEQRRSLPGQQREALQETRPSQGGAKICPQATPMLHSLSKEATGQGDRPRDEAAANGEDGSQEVLDPLSGKMARRSDRFATTLRNEIQMKKARLQKSKSAAALSGKCEAEEEEPEVCKAKENSVSSPSDGSFTSTYKDHLKEAQARVLKATSFRRRDLEPVLLEHPGAEAPPGYPASALPRKEASGSEALPGKPGGQVTRIGGRKRFSAEKKVRSFSEPDKIHEVGVDEDLAPPESAGSLVDRRKLFETPGKPAFPKPLPKHGPQRGSEEYRDTKARVAAPSVEAENNLREVRIRAMPPIEYAEEGQELLYSANRQAILEQQRLGTFAEYEATWNIQKKPPETRASGRYHSADNILDPGAEERTKPACVHERSRSSPSADFYGQNISVQGRKSAEYSQAERQPAERDNTAARFSEQQGHEDRRAQRDKPVELDRFPEPPPQLLTVEGPEHRRPVAAAAAGPAHHRPTSISRNPSDSALPGPDDHPHSEPPAGPRRKAPAALPRPPPPRLDKPGRPEIATPPLIGGGGDSQESLPGSQGGAPTARELGSAPVHAPPPLLLPEQSEELAEKEQGGVPPSGTSNPQQAPPRPPSPCSPSALTEPTMDGQRSPSPQFAPQRLTDKPPVSLRDENSNRMEDVTENNNPAVKKVPIKIVHSESLTEKESRQYLLHSEAPGGPRGPGALSQVSSLGAPDQSYSLFCAYSRQREPSAETDPESEPEPESAAVPPREHDTPAPPYEAPSSNGVAMPPHSQEDQKREELARDIMGKDKSLADILDQSKMRTTMDLMEGIFPQGDQLLEEAHQRRKVAPKQTSPRAPEERSEEDSLAAAVALVTSSAYYSTSAPKAELLIKMKDMQEQSEEPDSEDELLDNDNELASKKQELIDSLSRKLQVLREARESVQEDVQDNNALGEEVEATVQQVCKPNELDKFRMFVGDLDKVVSLLLSLSGRLARVENALNSLEEDAAPEERRTLTEKRKLLIRQHEDAKELKENLDRRERAVFDILASYLSEESLADYQHFVKMKSALIIEQRKLEDKIKLGDEQLKCLTDSLPLEQRLPL